MSQEEQWHRYSIGICQSATPMECLLFISLYAIGEMTQWASSVPLRIGIDMCGHGFQPLSLYYRRQTSHSGL